MTISLRRLSVLVGASLGCVAAILPSAAYAGVGGPVTVYNGVPPFGALNECVIVYGGDYSGAAGYGIAPLGATTLAYSGACGTTTLNRPYDWLRARAELYSGSTFCGTRTASNASNTFFASTTSVPTTNCSSANRVLYFDGVYNHPTLVPHPHAGSAIAL